MLLSHVSQTISPGFLCASHVAVSSQTGNAEEEETDHLLTSFLSGDPNSKHEVYGAGGYKLNNPILYCYLKGLDILQISFE